MKTRFLTLATLGCGAGLLAVSAWAKLPPPSDEAKAKAAEAAAKAAHAGKVDGFKLCQAMDRVAAYYRADAKKAGKDVKPPTETAACADPGPFAPAPLEAAGAHSPPKTAATPPNTATPAAAQAAAKKP